MKADEKNSKQLACLFRTAYFTAKETLSFLKFEKLCELQQLNGIPLYGENYKSNNACKRFISSIASDIKEDLRDDFNNARFVSIMSDGSTDKVSEIA